MMNLPFDPEDTPPLIMKILPLILKTYFNQEEPELIMKTYPDHEDPDPVTTPHTPIMKTQP